MVYDDGVYDDAEIGMGWRYTLVAKVRDADHAEAHMLENEGERRLALAKLADRDSAGPEELEAAGEVLDGTRKETTDETDA